MQNPTLEEIAHSLDFVADRLSRNLTMRQRVNGRWILRTEKRLAKRLKKLFRKQSEWIIKNMRSLFDRKASYRANAQGDDESINRFLDDMPHKADLTEEIVLVMNESLDRGAKQIMKELPEIKESIGFDIINREAARFLGKKKTLELSNYRGNIDGTTKGRILDILRSALHSGQSYEETSYQIAEQTDAGVFSQARGELIAVREIGIAYETGNRIPIDQFTLSNPDRVVLKFWQTVEDERVTKPHRKNQSDGWIPLAQTFSGTGDQQAPGSDNPRCRCTTKYRID